MLGGYCRPAPDRSLSCPGKACDPLRPGILSQHEGDATDDLSEVAWTTTSTLALTWSGGDHVAVDVDEGGGKSPSGTVDHDGCAGRAGIFR